MSNSTMKITVCMGSSCYARGNGENIHTIQNYLSQSGLSSQVEIIGHLCQDRCLHGPNMTINDQLYQQVDTAVIEGLLKNYAAKKP